MAITNATGINSTVLPQNQSIITPQASGSTSKIDDSKNSTTSQDSVTISSRSKNIQKLNEEFFSQGFESFTISKSFVERLTQYGLISAEEANKIVENVDSNDSAGNANPVSTVGELLDFIDSFSESVKKVDPENSLIDVLQQAEEVLKNFNSPMTSSENINITQVSRQLQNYVNTDGDTLPDSDKAAFKRLVSALDIADKLSPGKNTTAEINSYLSTSSL